eukprot:3719471-Prymnesium_polylepis.1
MRLEGVAMWQERVIAWTVRVKGLEVEGQPSGGRAHHALVRQLLDDRPIAGRRVHSYLVVVTLAREQLAVRREGAKEHLRTSRARALLAHSA